ncbi:4-(cytidine 5'-diphospho)-2-C-methyl-D-erythritol kinase [Tepidibacter formicigenes]|jgi:4-diphosphocytidyl-2-C-methyl-D-erythritol kinase|uniref:4-diphosphocytidyl-2-C-methyl-D-erythritol kinase n=1 Tax=Tepidibacter formicigenes DSM 15518 TaxID=1123349 RepID=A0A1M6SWD6_9FIRM|nr:4-(cytidine 5'-diphospho)-2-C-methyl-D-erythritol kinase [Tepidibacter formicigenes]SHK48878.1 4-diphosphocytidyl-2-C-methyl-D-erythritol kinase [Tepidibacter formicigenes DSM 15518]
MSFLKLKCRAKINLAIDVLGKRKDNYHLVEMIMQTIDLYDYVSIEEINSGIVIESNNPYVPLDSKNIAYKAVQLIKDKFNIDRGIKIKIEKNIPIAAGLAGGSTNAGGVLIGLNKLWDLKLSKDEIMDLGLKLGADVPFCIMGGAALAQGIGEKLTPINGLDNIHILICKPDISVSTAWVYNSLNMSKVNKRPNIEFLIGCLEKKDIHSLSTNMANVLECVTETKYTEITEIKRKMLEYKALGSMMSGSGPTVFGIFDNFNYAKYAKEKLGELYKQTYLIKSYEGGIEVEG